MRYSNVVPGVFLARPNRFVAHVELNGAVQICHVKNTGRCRELLPVGAKVWCRYDPNPARKTHYDLIAVQKGSRLINMDSQAPNAATKQWLAAGGLGEIEDLRAEFVHGDSRFDFFFTQQGKPCLLEVKGVTLEWDGICAFPDAPTQRGARHLRGLRQALGEGWQSYVLFVIQMEDAVCLRPNEATDPAFARELRQAAAEGLEVLAVACQVTPDSMTISHRIPVEL